MLGVDLSSDGICSFDQRVVVAGWLSSCSRTQSFSVPHFLFVFNYNSFFGHTQPHRFVKYCPTAPTYRAELKSDFLLPCGEGKVADAARSSDLRRFLRPRSGIAQYSSLNCSRSCTPLVQYIGVPLTGLKSGRLLYVHIATGWRDTLVGGGRRKIVLGKRFAVYGTLMAVSRTGMLYTTTHGILKIMGFVASVLIYHERVIL